MPVSTWVEVDLDRLGANLAAIRGLLAPRQEVLLVAKADAYGHGAIDIAEAAAREGVERLGVATLHEGIQLRQAGCGLPIIALSPLLPSEVDEAIAHGIDPTVCDLGFAARLSDAARRAGHALRCHVEVDTGMGRAGVRIEDAETFLERLARVPGVRVASLYTHFPDADGGDPGLAFARDQLARFDALVARLAERGLKPPRLHAANSAGTLNLDVTRYDWVRVGLAAYGHRPPNDASGLALQPVMAFKSRLVQVRWLPAGASVSYARTRVVTRPTRLGVVAVGYGHGYSWRLSDRGHVLVDGRRAPILGRVTMDLTMVDLTEVPRATVGDEVVLFGEQGGARVTIEEVAAASDTLPYEVMSTIGKRVARIYVRGGRPVRLTSLVGERAEWAERAADHFRARDRALAAARPRGG
jgi:alanine racemase